VVLAVVVLPGDRVVGRDRDGPGEKPPEPMLTFFVVAARAPELRANAATAAGMTRSKRIF